MDNIDNEEFKEMDNKLEEVSTRARSEAEEENKTNKNGIFITSMKVVVEEKKADNKSEETEEDKANGDSFVEKIKKR